MKDGAAILKILSVQNCVFLKMIKMSFYRERICEYELKTTYFGIVYFCLIQFAASLKNI